MQELLRQFPKLLAAVAVVLASLAVFAPIGAQTPTAEQLEMLRKLPPEQQRAVLEELQKGGGQPTIGEPALTTPQTVLPVVEPQQLVPEDPAKVPLRGGDTVIIELTPRQEPDLAPGQVAPTDAFADRVRLGNPYRLDKAGRLILPGIPPIVLAGLNSEQSAKRLRAEPDLVGYTVAVTYLPVERTGVDALKPFGYDLFEGVPTTFAPATDVPVPPDYVVGPGDRIQVELFDNMTGSYSLVVDREGVLDFPGLGPIPVAGRTFDQMRADLVQRVSEQMIGVRASISMGELRSIRVFVLGEARTPGSFTVSGLSTITNALFVSGGVKEIGSLRNIQLKRNGRIVQRLDLYDLLLNGDTSADVRLLPGDVIFVPPVGITVGIDGEVRRPAIYEVGEGATSADLLYLAGGLTPEAHPQGATIERVRGREERTVENLDLTQAQGRALRVRAGDVLRVPSILERMDGMVELVGHVFRPGIYQFREGMRLTDLVGSLSALKPNADLHYVLIRRETGPDRLVTTLSADLEAAFGGSSGDANPALAPRDKVIVFDLEGGRDRVIAPVLEQLRLQATRDRALAIATVSGRVRAPGRYPIEPGMRVADLIRAGGGLAESAYTGESELTRYEVVEGEYRQTELVTIDLAAVRAGDAGADLLLRPYDTLNIKEIPEWRDQEVVELVGELRFPGKYPIRRGETLLDVIDRAGGLTEHAFPKGVVFTRTELREREAEQLKVLTERLQADLASLALSQAQESGQSNQALAAGQQLLRDLRSTRPVGRLAIDFERVLSHPRGSTWDVLLRDGDRLLVPKQKQEVTVLGEVQSATSHFFDPNLSRDDYVRLSGGMTSRADKKRIYVIRANGMVESGEGSLWFRRSHAVNLGPGDTIVVPLDAERMRPLPLWTAVTTIIYNLAVAVAAVNSF